MIPTDLKTYQEMQTITRAGLARQLGMSYGGERDLYEALGYKKELVFDDFWNTYRRNSIARAVIDRPAKKSWQGKLEILQGNNVESTPLELAWKQLRDNLNLKSKLSLLDRLSGIGRYGVLLMGLSDVKTKQDWRNPVSGKVQLLYVRALDEQNAKINQYEDNTENERYGKPKIYNVTVKNIGTGATNTFEVHHSRIIHVMQDNLEDEVHGTPRLEAVYNELQNIEKIAGGSAEMFWRGARPGYQANVDPEFTLTPSIEKDLKGQVNEYEHNLRRILINQGVKMTALESQISDPTSHIEVQIQLISSETGIPKRILLGSERGELASSQDKEAFLSLIQARRDEFIEPCILRPLITRCMEYGVLPKAQDWSIDWDDLFAPSDKEKADVGKTRSQALKDYMQTPGAMEVVPPKAFFEFFLGLQGQDILLIEEMMDEWRQNEDLPQDEQEELEEPNITDE